MLTLFHHSWAPTPKVCPTKGENDCLSSIQIDKDWQTVLLLHRQPMPIARCRCLYVLLSSRLARCVVLHTMQDRPTVCVRVWKSNRNVGWPFRMVPFVTPRSHPNQNMGLEFWGWTLKLRPKSDRSAELFLVSDRWCEVMGEVSISSFSHP